MKQVEVAKNAEITKAHLNGILSGRNNPSKTLAERLDELTGIPKEVWMFGTGPERRAAWKQAKEARA